MTKKKTTIPKILLSSVGDGKISLTLKSAAVLIIITGLEYAGVTADKGIIIEVVNQIATIVSAGFILYGLARKIK